jgi:hypothetical protein
MGDDDILDLPEPSPNKTKPVDKWLGIGGIVVTILLFLFGKTPALVVILAVLIFALLIHPIWNFWWIEEYKGRQIFFSALLAMGCFLIGYAAWPEPPSTEVNQGRTAQQESFIQVDGISFSGDTILPFQPGQRIGLNFGLRNTGTALASNIHIHSRTGFIGGGEEAEEQEIDKLFKEVYQEILDFYAHHNEGKTVSPNEVMGNYFSTGIQSPSKHDIEGFYNKKRGICAVVRIEYDYTHYYEQCVVFAYDNLQEFTLTGRMHFNNCHTHNRVGLHPLDSLF